MITQMYAVLDTKGAYYTVPHFQPRDEMAVRSFRDAIANPQVEMSRHPEDYNLYHVGAFNDADGSLIPNATGPRFICSGLGEVENG